MAVVQALSGGLQMSKCFTRSTVGPHVISIYVLRTYILFDFLPGQEKQGKYPFAFNSFLKNTHLYKKRHLFIFTVTSTAAVHIKLMIL